MENLTEFNHETEVFSEALGISEERRMELNKIVLFIVPIPQPKSKAASDLIDKSRNLGEVVYCLHQYFLTMDRLTDIFDDPLKEALSKIEQIKKGER